jgi:gas vesicle protein
MAPKSNNHATDTLVIVGASVVGAGLALLFAPKSGRMTRKDIVRFIKSVGTQKKTCRHSKKGAASRPARKTLNAK